MLQSKSDGAVHVKCIFTILGYMYFFTIALERYTLILPTSLYYTVCKNRAFGRFLHFYPQTTPAQQYPYFTDTSFLQLSDFFPV